MKNGENEKYTCKIIISCLPSFEKLFVLSYFDKVVNQ